MRVKYVEQLESLNDQLIEMGRLCENAIWGVTKAIKKGDKKKIDQVIKDDMKIDAMEKDIERLCLKLILEQQPVARDLRQISAALKMITDMERIGDQATDIGELILSADVKYHEHVREIEDMAALTSEMVHNSVRAYVEKDFKLAGEVIDQDDQVDQLFLTVRGNLVKLIAIAPQEGSLVLDFLMVAKYLERIGDHATNIAEWVEFSITGVHRKSHI